MWDGMQEGGVTGVTFMRTDTSIGRSSLLCIMITSFFLNVGQNSYVTKIFH